MKRFPLLLALLGLSLPHCGDAPDATEIVVLVEADPMILDRADRFEVLVQGREPGGMFTTAETLRPMRRELPLQFSITPAGGDLDRQWRVQGTALGPMGGLVTQAWSGRYLEGESRVVRIYLAGRCEPVRCPARETCAPSGACLPEQVDSSMLPEYQGGAVPPSMVEVPVACEGPGDCPDDGMFCNGGRECGPAGACVSTAPPCGPDSFCDETIRTCRGNCGRDADGDGFVDAADGCGGDDCNDEQEAINPDATEIGNDELDNDCDGELDECTGMDAVEESAAVCADGCDNDGNGLADCDDPACDGFGPCRACGCGVGQSCLTRPGYQIDGECGEPCTVGDPGGCSADAESCWWNGVPGDPSGTCRATVVGNGGSPPGERCNVDADCASPSGHGWCLTAARDGFSENGFCSSVDCAGPGATGGCARGFVCVPRGEGTSYCLRACEGTELCPANNACAPVAGPANTSVCAPRCDPRGVLGCGESGTCAADGSVAVCLPGSDPSSP